MHLIDVLAFAFGLAALTGLNLYLTVFAISLGLNLGWIIPDPAMAQIQILAHPAILVLAGIFSFLEFLADKIPWVDSFWDFAHTFIRPIGAAFLALAVIGSNLPILQISTALFCAAIALMVHLTKAGIRLSINTTPERFMNIVISFCENLLLIAGLIIVHLNPQAFAVAVIVFCACFIIAAPRLISSIWTVTRFIYHSVFRFSHKDSLAEPLPNTLPILEREQLNKDLESGETILWAVPTLTGRNKKMRIHQHAFLVSIGNPDPQRIGLLVRNQPIRWIEMGSLEIHDSRKLLFDEISIYSTPTSNSISLRFFKHRRVLVEKMLQALGKDFSHENATTRMKRAATPRAAFMQSI
jgi:hypothetical protein